MGLIKAFLGATTTTFGDQWLEYFYCDSLDKNTLMVKGQKRVNSKKSSNKHGSDNIISNGSVIAVNEGQCMIIVDQGAVIEFTAEPGEFKWDKSTEGSFFGGEYGDGIFKTIIKRFKYGGDTGKDQRVYYFNTKELMDNKFGTAQPIPFRVVDSKVGLDIDVSLRCNGVFSYKITNPILFYQNVAGNVTGAFTRDMIDTQLKTEFISALQPSLGKLSEMELRPNQIIAHVPELEAAMNNTLSEKWRDTRGLELMTIALGSVTLPKEDEDLIKNIQRQAVYRNPGMAGASLVEAQGTAMKGAASNAGGAMMGFMGLGMAQQAGGMNANAFYQMDAKQQEQMKAQGGWTCSCGTQNTGKFCANCGKPKPEANNWTCSCGTQNTGKFCANCGKPKPEASNWTCSCGTQNTGKFCANCGKPSITKIKCDKCGWEPKDLTKIPKFCPECGDPITENDK